MDAADTLKKKLSSPLCRIVFNKFYPFILFQLWHIMTIALDKSYKSTFYLQLHNEMSAYKCVVIFSNIILVETTWMCLTVD